MVEQSLAGKVAIVTGASRGLGKDIAFKLAERGANVVATYTSESSTPSIEELQKQVSALQNNTRILPVRADLGDISAAKTIVDATLAAFPHIDILVNNAGVMPVVPLSDITPETYTSAFDVNVRAVLLLTQAVTPHLRAPGRIINMSSVGARANYAGVSLYIASKSAVEGFTRSWAMELGTQGHTVNCVAPGPVMTDMLREMDQGVVKGQVASTPVERRIGQEDDVSQIVCFLAEERSRWVSGQCISASGGYAVY